MKKGSLFEKFSEPEKKGFFTGSRLRRWFFIGAMGLLVLLAGAAGAFAVLSLNLPTAEEIANRQVTQSTKIYDRTGQILLYETGAVQKRTVLVFEDLPQSLKDATIAIEDERFYSEAALDWRGIIRAMAVNAISGRVVQGASTITQQLARNAFLSPERSLTRKMREAILAVRLGRQYTKDEILALYLNEIPYGSTFYGVEAAARGYFGKSANELNLAESAVLAAIVKAPSYYSPWGSHKQQLIDRQQLTLQKMLQLGMITEQQRREAIDTPLVFQPQAQGIKAPHFSLMIQEYLAGKYGEDLVNKGGLKVVTTLDWDLQQAAEKAVEEGAKRNEELYKGKNAALVSEDPKTGQILAYVGSRNYFDTANDGNYNVPAQGLRQPGSSIKPFVYMTAFQKGYTPDTVVFDVPTEFASGNPNCPAIVDFSNRNPQCFHPQNFELTFEGPVSLRKALGQSMNVPAVQVLYLAGLRDAIANAELLGIDTLNDPDRLGLTLVLGGGEVRLLDMVGAYSVLAQDGMRHEQAFILEVKDAKDQTLESYEDKATQVVDPQYPRLVNSILTDVETRAGLFQSSLDMTLLPGHTVAFKTGTTNDSRDAWAFGFTPGIVTGVWAGNNNNAPMQRRGSSLVAAVPIWKAYMSEAIKKFQPENFTPPEPAYADKPMLNGNYWSDTGIHSILYYVNRNDPLGPPPNDPASDPQFHNWESAIASWLQQNPFSLPFPGTTSTPPLASSTPSTTSTVGVVAAQPPLSISLIQPQNGDFVDRRLTVMANLSSKAPINSMKIFFNNKLVLDSKQNVGLSHLLTWEFTPAQISNQNAIRVEVANQRGDKAKEEIIVYYQNE